MARPTVFGILFGSTLVAGSVSAATPSSGGVWLEVGRAPGTEACPDTARVLAAANRLFPEQPMQPRPRADADFQVSIAIERRADGHEATLTLHGQKPAERRIVDRDPACAGLAEAIAVALVVWRGSFADGNPQPPPESAAPPAKANEAPTERDGPSRAPVLALGVEVGALGSVGLLGRPAFGADAGLAFWHALGLGLRARLARVVALATDVPPGEVNTDLWALRAAACWRLRQDEAWALVPCLELGWGRQHSEASELSGENGEAERLWLGAGGSLGLVRRLTGPLSARAEGGLLVRMHDQRYRVDGQVVERQPPVGGYLGLGLNFEWTWSDDEPE